MKKTILAGLLAVVLSFPSIGVAATVGNFADTRGVLSKFSLGIEYDGVFDRDMDRKTGPKTEIVGTTAFPLPGQDIEDIEIDSNRVFLKWAVGLHPNVDIFVKLGMASANCKAKYKDSPLDSGIKIEFDNDWDFGLGVGAKVKIFETYDGLRFFGNAQYLSYMLDGDFKTNANEVEEIIQSLSTESEFEIKEWQVSLYMNQTFGNFSPYAGVKYSEYDAHFEFKGDNQVMSIKIEGDAEAENNFGIFLGTDIYVIPNLLSINLEARFLDETAVTFGLNYIGFE